MNNRHLPTEITINGTIYPINQNGDYGMVLDVIEVLNDKELSDQERALVSLCIFYNFNLPETEDELKTAVYEMIKFINGGEDDTHDQPGKKPLMNWNKDFRFLVAPINRVVGYDIRSAAYVHWWTVLSAYMEIGECMFQNIVNIRSKKQRGKKLEKWEEEFYNENRDKIDLGVDFSAEEEQYLKDLLGVDF